ncbi:MAG: hypothetical protein ACHBN1_10745 [Heteroscytonema crispum UTEX LB 1556]
MTHHQPPTNSAEPLRYERSYAHGEPLRPRGVSPSGASGVETPSWPRWLTTNH